jgi:hypothetical protein
MGLKRKEENEEKRDEQGLDIPGALPTRCISLDDFLLSDEQRAEIFARRRERKRLTEEFLEDLGIGSFEDDWWKSE